MVQGLRFRFQALGGVWESASDSELKLFVFTGCSLPTSCLICCDIGWDEKGAGRVLVVQIPFLRNLIRTSLLIGTIDPYQKGTGRVLVQIPFLREGLCSLTYWGLYLERLQPGS